MGDLAPPEVDRVQGSRVFFSCRSGDAVFTKVERYELDLRDFSHRLISGHVDGPE